MDCEASGSRYEPASAVKTVSRKELFLVLKSDGFYKLSSLKCNERLVSYLLDKYRPSELRMNIKNKLKNVIKVFVCKLLTKWKESRNTYDRFLKRNTKWLDGLLNLPQFQTSNTAVEVPMPTTRKGRPRKIFSESSETTKRRKIRPIIAEISPEELCHATETSLIKKGKRSAAQIVKLALDSTPRRLRKMKQIQNASSFSTLRPYTPEEALALIVDLGLGKNEYTYLQTSAKARGANIYPTYNVIAEQKKLCYLPNIKITETEAEIPLQDLLELTIRRLVQVQNEVLLQLVSEEVINIDVIYKWGLDGSGGHSIYKQNFSNNSQYAIILCTVVPLEMSAHIEGNKKFLCKNQRPSSLRYCRVILFKLQKETSESIKEVYQKIEAQITQLQPTTDY